MNFKFFSKASINGVIYPPHIINKSDDIKRIYSSGWLMYLDGCLFRDCPYDEQRYKNIWYSGFLDARNKSFGYENI